MKDKVSIIIPVYNSKKYLKECIQSILFQSYENIEVIIVDDGSTDGSKELLDKIAQKYNNIYVIHQSNKGVSVARNIGLRLATGDYIVFADADDRYKSNAIENLLKYSEYDLVCGSYEQIEDGKLKLKVYEEKTYELENIIDLERDVASAPWGKLYKHDIIIRNNIEFPVDIPCGEDTCFFIRYLTYINTAICIKSIIYKYNYGNRDSAMHKYYPNLYKYLNFALEEKKKYCLIKNIDIDIEKDKIRYYNLCLEHYTLNHDFVNLKKAKDVFGISKKIWLSIISLKLCKVINCLLRRN